MYALTFFASDSYAELYGRRAATNWDVFVFHSIGEYTDGDHLWLRIVYAIVRFARTRTETATPAVQ